MPTISVKVPQSDGEILISRAGAEPVAYPVTAGQVEVEVEHIDGFLRQVPGSELAAGNPSKEA